MIGWADHRQEKCVPMPPGSAGFASKRRSLRGSRGKQRDHGTAGIARRREPVLSFTQDARMGRAYGECRLSPDFPDDRFVFLYAHAESVINIS